MSIKIQNLTKVYGQQKALNNIGFEISKGEIVGFLGPNGAGKSTTMKILSGYLKPTGGTATLNGVDVDTESKEIKKHIGYLPEHNPLYLDMYVEEFLNFVGSLYGFSKSQLKERTEEIIKKVGLGPEKHKKIAQLSKGYRQRVGLAQALIHNPAVLILDEPTTGLDPNQLVEIRELIKQVGKDKTVILSTHIMQEVEAICDRVIIINHGEIVADAALSEIKKEGNSLEAIFRKLTSA
ncbi:ATP-binding cassette domain-containing protein [Emticicia sp. CRIBPO]|uniref:ATP-binding cassette domain-containing protein n=1 Tax=Emticicia sp. CRIBPO TaxID=2683258 RepID=UPI0014123A07|nr:ATP-binding cassette domain-containing protein [Emticicia sp. CRIBPO]NBA86472.1 ATP-binding cassette domain-containing protein [Emticicia sp. CRIBPO]